MVRVGRAIVEIVLWVGVLGALSLMFVWWDLRPAAHPHEESADVDLARRAAIYGSFLLVAAGTALAVWIADRWVLARLAALFTGAALWASSMPWADIDGAGAVVWTLRGAAVVVWLVAALGQSAVWGPAEPGVRPPRAVLVAGLIGFGFAIGYGCLALGVALDLGFLHRNSDGQLGWRYGVPALGVLALGLPAARHLIRALMGGDGGVAQVTEIGA